MVGWKDPLCPYECSDGLTPFADNPYCVTDFELFVSNMGGFQIFVIIIIATLFGIITVLYFLKFNQSKFDEEDDQIRLMIAFEELDFIDRDIQQHIGRVHLLGKNQALSPWHLPNEPPL